MCKRFKLSEAKHKSGIIAEQIQRQIVEKKEKEELSTLRKNAQLIALTDKRNRLNEELKQIDAEMKKKLANLGLKEQSWYDDRDLRQERWVIDEGNCLVPQKTLNALQRATDLQALGKIEDAQKIWDTIIQEYSLGTQ